MKNHRTEKPDTQDRALLVDTWRTWHIPEIPASLSPDTIDRHSLALCASAIQKQLTEARDILQKKTVEGLFIDWLYSTVRYNIKRSRTYELHEVLHSGKADCLGYARLFASLGTLFGVKLGVIEVLIDNAGRHVPHYVNLTHLADNSRRFIDLWYGSTDIRHRRIAALINGTVNDINMRDINDTDKIEGLPGNYIRALTLYIKGNRFLEHDDMDDAIACYSEAIGLYPGNSRIWFNRAIAYERRKKFEDAQHDYAVAFKDNAGIIRIMANIEELEELIRLDENHIAEREQDIYLYYKGFKTGEPATCELTGKKYGITAEETTGIISRIANSM